MIRHIWLLVVFSLVAAEDLRHSPVNETPEGRAWPTQWTDDYDQYADYDSSVYPEPDAQQPTLERLITESLKNSPLRGQSRLLQEMMKLLQFASNQKQNGADFSLNELISRAERTNVHAEGRSGRRKRHLRNIFVTPLMIANYLGYTPFPFPGLPKHMDPGSPSHVPYRPWSTHF